MPKGFDPRCYELAAVFLPDNANRDEVSELAQLIQDTIEDHLNYVSASNSAGFPLGTRVTLSTRGRAFKHRRFLDRIGTVVAKSTTSDCVGVRWDGNRGNQVLHIGLLSVAGVQTPSIEAESPARVEGVEL